MKGQLPSIDEDVRAQLARRSAGRLPEGLTTQVLGAVDAAAAKPRFVWRPSSLRSALAVPRTLLAGAGLAAVVLLAAALVVFPRFQTTPASGLAGYPAERALTTAELAGLMSGPALPTNTTLVADAKMYLNSDTCPMNRYRTVGVVEGMASQVCVVTPSDVLTQPPALSGTFAFRYLAPGVLGLIGEITPASSAKVAYRVADDWPLQGKTFLVEGWLTQLRFPLTDVAFCTGGTPVPAGDPLDPSGSDPCVGTWLTDETSSLPTEDSGNLIVPKAARFVEAAGMGEIDAIPGGVAVGGVYVVRSVTEPCPSAPPQDSRGCGVWRVLARVAEISVPGPRGTPPAAPTAAPTTAPPATPLAPSSPGVIGTDNRPLTADELETLMVEQPDHLAGRIVIVEAPIPTQISCQSDASGGGCAVNTKSLAGSGVWAVSIGADGTLSLVGEVTVPQSGFVFPLGQAVATWSKAATEKQFFVVDAWLGGAGETACDIVGSPCYEASWLGSTAAAREVDVQLGDYHRFGGGPVGGGAAIHGVFLVEWVPAATGCATGQDTASCTGLAHAQVVSRVETGAVP